MHCRPWWLTVSPCASSDGDDEARAEVGVRVGVTLSARDSIGARITVTISARITVTISARITVTISARITVTISAS